MPIIQEGKFLGSLPIGTNEVKIEVNLVFKDKSGDELDEMSSYKRIDGKKLDTEKKVRIKNDPSSKDKWHHKKSSASKADLPFYVKKLTFLPHTGEIDVNNTEILVNENKSPCKIKDLGSEVDEQAELSKD